MKKGLGFPKPFRIGGGEIRTLVLGKHPPHDYMLIASDILIDLTGRRPISDLRARCNLGFKFICIKLQLLGIG